MRRVDSRAKGARGERELLLLLSAELGEKLERDLSQARGGGADCVMIDGFSLEIKRCETLRLPAWWRQAVRQANDAGQEPIVFYRQSRRQWRALIVRGHGYADVDWHAGVGHIREKWARWP